MSELKPVKMWAVYGPLHDEIQYTKQGSRKASIHMLEKVYGVDWIVAERMGYTVRRVTVTPDPESEK